MKIINRIFPHINQNYLINKSGDLSRLMEMHGILADLVTRAPRSLAEVTCFDGTNVEPGAELSITQLEKPPALKWNFEKNNYYFMCMLGLDAPTRKNPSMRQWQHWIVGNIVDCDVENGHVYAEYLKPQPDEATGLHRYVFLVFKQPELVHFPFQTLSAHSAYRRGHFSIADVAKKYSLYNPIAGNFLHAQ